LGRWHAVRQQRLQGSLGEAGGDLHGGVDHGHHQEGAREGQQRQQRQIDGRAQGDPGTPPAIAAQPAAAVADRAGDGLGHHGQRQADEGQPAQGGGLERGRRQPGQHDRQHDGVQAVPEIGLAKPGRAQRGQTRRVGRARGINRHGAW